MTNNIPYGIFKVSKVVYGKLKAKIRSYSYNEVQVLGYDCYYAILYSTFGYEVHIMSRKELLANMEMSDYEDFLGGVLI